MKTIRHFLLALSVLLMLWTPQGRAEDIDIYTGGAGSTEVPNVLFVIDNGANFEANGGSGPCTAYAAGGAPSLGSSNGGIQQCALVDAIDALPAGTVNIGLLVGNANGFASGYIGMATSNPAYYTTCDQSTGFGGCVIRPLALMNADNKANLISFIKSWQTSGSDSATAFNVKASGNKTGNMMQEAWAYYNGKVGMSGRNYATSLLSSGCQKNFIIFVANAAGSSSTPADTPTGQNDADPSNSTRGLTSAQVAATATQQAKITGSIAFNPAVCGSTSVPLTSGQADNWADEWARLMSQQDGASGSQGTQNITSYAVGIIGTSCKPEYPALLTSVAKHGGGKYYSASSATDLKLAFDQILNEIQAVNSVFASASLPVSVNAQGTFLNQIFLGMFRPDATASPRWLGNLKQFQLVFSGGNLVLGDATGAPALSSAGTGFIASASQSYWTKKNILVEPDLSGGFYVNDPKGEPLSGFDLPDGQLVEKGGAAQQLRIENLTADFAATAGDPPNPRRLYTYCPNNVSCELAPALTHANNQFSIANTGIVATDFGDNTTVAINSIVRSGTSAVVTTVGNHGLPNGTTVTISSVDQNEYNGSKVISLASGNVFTITGLPDYPTTPSLGAYTISTVGVTPVPVSTISRSSSASGGNNSETVTVTTLGAHGFLAGNTITIAGTTPTNYSGNFVIATPGGACPLATCFTYSIPIYPTTAATNIYAAVVSPYSRNIVSITDTGAGGIATVTTSTAHNYHVGQKVVFASTGNSRYDGAATGSPFTVATTPSSTVFTFTGYSVNPANVGAVGTTSPSTAGIAITLTRAATTDAATATAAGATAGAFGVAIGNTKVLNVVRTAGTSGNESQYEKTSVTVTCSAGNCTSFTYAITTSPSTTISGTVTASPLGAAAVSATIAAGNMTRSGTTTTATGVAAGFINGDSVNVAVSGAAFSNETAYLGTWTISCTAPCSTLTFGPVALTPSPATGSNKQAFAADVPPDKDALVKWVRGQDNQNDELGPGGTVKVRPSIHGDVLHSRPVVINYGTSTTPNVVAFYGANDGVFRAVNGNQTAAIGTVPAGGELWGLVLRDHFPDLNRLRMNSPELKLPTTTLASAQPKDYFVDGPNGAFQQLKSDGTIDKAYLYLTMRRGGRFIYAIDVSTPTAPVFMWKINAGDTGFEELGQTWSRPRVTLVNGYANPVLIFGGGYDPAEDTEAPSASTMGRGIFVVDATTGVRVWSAIYGGSAACSGSTTLASCTVPTMTHSIPSDMAFLDRNSDGKIDRMYAGDMGGNVWRVDFVTTSGNTPDKWQVTKLAALGCATGICSAGTTPRKFFFPPTVVSIGATNASGSYEAVLLGSGDREHPLINTSNPQSAHLVQNRFYMIKDTLTTATPSTTDLANIKVRTETNPLADETKVALFKAFKSAAINGMAWAGGVLTVTTDAAHTFANGNTVVIDGASPASLNGHHKIVDAGTLGSTTFTIAMASNPGAVGAGGSATVAVPFAFTDPEPGFYTFLATGEKVVNAPITVSGTSFFGTNRPIPPSAICVTNLGEARGYAIDPFTGSATSTVYDGGGLPPSPVAGVVNIQNADGSTLLVRFCMGCGGGTTGGTADEKSAIGNTDPYKAVPKKPSRTYWYRR